MITIALTGPDGAGKSTMSRRLEKSLPIPAKYIYMGINPEASNLELPTTFIWNWIKKASGRQTNQGGPPDLNGYKPLSRNPVKRAASELKSGLRALNLILEEWFRQFVAWYYQLRGYIVIFDRHFFFDYFMHHVSNKAERSIGNRIHGAMLSRFFPKPNLVILLDAPPEILFARKGEGTLESLERRRQEYLQLRQMVTHFVIVDASQSEEAVTKQVSDLILDFYSWKKKGKTRSMDYTMK
jgi:thymidylate kinase